MSKKDYTTDDLSMYATTVIHTDLTTEYFTKTRDNIYSVYTDLTGTGSLTPLIHSRAQKWS